MSPEKRDTTLPRMESQLQTWQSADDRRAVFLHCYMLMTRNMLRDVDREAFRDPPWVNQLLHHFADYYFDALATYEQDPARAPAVWRPAFDAGRRSDVHPVQQLLLGVNAHINYDLVLALYDLLSPEWRELNLLRRRARYADHRQVNVVIGRTIDAVQDTVLEPVRPELDMVDRLLGPADEWLISRLITRWRDQVWDHAVRLVETPEPEARERLRRRIEAEAIERADRIMLARRP